MQEWKYSPDLQKFRFRKWLNLRKMWLFFFCSTLSHIYFDILFCPQLFERELRRWAGHERNMSLSSHALYDNKQVHTLTSETKLRRVLSVFLKSAGCHFVFFCILSENLSASDVGGGDICSSRSGVHSSVREKRLRGPDELRQEGEAGIWWKQPGDTSINEM